MVVVAVAAVEVVGIANSPAAHTLVRIESSLPVDRSRIVDIHRSLVGRIVRSHFAAVRSRTVETAGLVRKTERQVGSPEHPAGRCRNWLLGSEDGVVAAFDSTTPHHPSRLPTSPAVRSPYLPKLSLVERYCPVLETVLCDFWRFSC